MNTSKVGQKGFTLVELLVVVTIIGILASIVIPNYSDYVTRGKLQEGSSNLANTRIFVERFYQDNRTYVGSPCPAQTKNFNYACSGLSTTQYTITATGRNNLSAYSYTINEANVKGSTTPWGNNTTCWVIKKGGGC